MSGTVSDELIGGAAICVPFTKQGSLDNASREEALVGLGGAITAPFSGPMVTLSGMVAQIERDSSRNAELLRQEQARSKSARAATLAAQRAAEANRVRAERAEEEVRNTKRAFAAQKAAHVAQIIKMQDDHAEKLKAVHAQVRAGSNDAAALEELESTQRTMRSDRLLAGMERLEAKRRESVAIEEHVRASKKRSAGRVARGVADMLEKELRAFSDRFETRIGLIASTASACVKEDDEDSLSSESGSESESESDGESEEGEAALPDEERPVVANKVPRGWIQQMIAEREAGPAQPPRMEQPPLESASKRRRVAEDVADVTPVEEDDDDAQLREIDVNVELDLSDDESEELMASGSIPCAGWTTDASGAPPNSKKAPSVALLQVFYERTENKARVNELWANGVHAKSGRVRKSGSVALFDEHSTRSMLFASEDAMRLIFQEGAPVVSFDQLRSVVGGFRYELQRNGNPLPDATEKSTLDGKSVKAMSTELVERLAKVGKSFTGKCRPIFIHDYDDEESGESQRIWTNLTRLGLVAKQGTHTVRVCSRNSLADCVFGALD